MFKTIKYSVSGKPLLDINEQGVVYSYKDKALKRFKTPTEANPYLSWGEKDSDGTYHTYYVHIEVAKAFPRICGRWYEGCHIHHKDGNKLNNEAINLIVCTPQQHKEFHKIMKIEEEKKKGKQLKEKAKLDFLDQTSNYTNVDDFTFHYYCRKSKVDRNGLAPIELVIYRKSDGKKVTKYTGFKQKPIDFENGILPEGFETFNNKYFKNEDNI